MSSTDRAAGPPTYTTDEARLQAEVTRLRAELEGRVRTPRRRGWWRPVVAGVLVALAALMAPLSVLATWASGQIQDTDRYLATVAPLADDPDIQDAIAARIEQVVFSYLDLDAATDQLVEALDTPSLPPEAAATLRALSGPLGTGVQGFVQERIVELVRSDAFATAWVEANRTAHTELVAALTGDTDGSVQIDRGAVSVNLAVLVNTVKAQLKDAGFGMAERIPEVDATFAIVQSDELGKVQTLLGLLDDLSLWLPVVGLGLLAAAVYIARDRWRTLVGAGLAVAASMLLLGATLNIVRPFYLDALPASSSAAAAGVVYDQLVSFIRLALRGLLVVALTVAVVAWFNTSGGAGARARSGLGNALDAVRRRREGAGVGTGRLGAVLAQYRGPVRVAVVGIVAFGYLAQDHPTGGTALALVLGAGVLLLLAELLAAGRGEPEDEPSVASA
jgi:hypothetical protein